MNNTFEAQLGGVDRFDEEAAERNYEARHDAWLGSLRCGLCGANSSEARYDGDPIQDLSSEGVETFLRPDCFDAPAEIWTDHLVCDDCVRRNGLESGELTTPGRG